MYAEGKVIIDPNTEFAVKVCNMCGDTLHINNSDVLGLEADGKNHVELSCPVCGAKFTMTRYFSGTIYTTDLYDEVAYRMHNQICELCNKIDDINRGHGTEYISVSSLHMSASGLDISIDVHIDVYKHKDWKALEKSDVHYTTFKLYPYECIYRRFVHDYAAYVQALGDYLCNTALKTCTQYRYENIVRSDEEWIAFVRGGETRTAFDRYNKYLYVKQEQHRNEKTLFIPDVVTGSDMIRHGIIDAGEKIQDGLYSVASSVGGVMHAIKETPSQTYLINKY